jgi:hypothetical protein
MSDSSAKRVFWREVRRRTWSHSKEHFAWLIPIATGLVVFLLSWRIGGWARAVQDMTTSLYSAAAAVIVALLLYCFNLVRSASEVYAEEAG